jgi:hypothetical protein
LPAADERTLARTLGEIHASTAPARMSIVCCADRLLFADDLDEFVPVPLAPLARVEARELAHGHACSQPSGRSADAA